MTQAAAEACFSLHAVSDNPHVAATGKRGSEKDTHKAVPETLVGLVVSFLQCYK